MSKTLTYLGEEPMRVNKWMAQEGVCSRREAEGLIERGLVKVDGETLTSPGHKILPGQTLVLAEQGGHALASKLTVVMNKPEGIVSGTPEGEQVPAVRLLTRSALHGTSDVIPGRGHKLAPVGRLDQDSHGLLILSEDGVVAKAVIGPDSDMDKEYIVRVRGGISDAALEKLRHGLSLDGRRLKKAVVERLGEQTLRFVLREGRNRQIRRMCDLVGIRVIDLKRERIGPLELGNLPEGKWRMLTDAERAALIEAGKPKMPKRAPREAKSSAPVQAGQERAPKARQQGRRKSQSGPVKR
ncbi:MAG: pseudouridine synthase [Pseudomonadota bacterium]